MKIMSQKMTYPTAPPEFSLIIKGLTSVIKAEIAGAEEILTPLIKEEMNQHMKKIPQDILDQVFFNITNSVTEQLYKYFNTGAGRQKISAAINSMGKDYADEIVRRMRQTAGTRVDTQPATSPVNIKETNKPAAADVPRHIDTLMDAINPFQEFIDDCCELTKQSKPTTYTPTVDIWYAYSEWCREGHNRPLGRNKFLEQIRATYMNVRKGRKFTAEGKYISVFFNIRLTDEGQKYARQGMKHYGAIKE